MLPNESRKLLIVQACLYSVPAILHLFGLYLLYTVRELDSADDQRLYLKHLSIVELLFCIGKILHRCLAIHGHDDLAYKAWILQTSLLFTVYTLIMILVTLDRFLAIYLNIKYKLYVTKLRINLCVGACWILSGAVSLSCYWGTSRADVDYVIVVYIWPAEEFLFISVACPVYFYIFVRLHENRRKTTKTLKALQNVDKVHLTLQPSNSASKRWRTRDAIVRKVKKNLFIPTLLIATFVLFWIVPDQMEFFSHIKGVTHSPDVYFFINLSYILAVCSDALIYTFGIPSIKKYVLNWRKWQRPYWQPKRRLSVIERVQQLI